MIDPKKIQQDFPIFQNRPGITYLDSAATSLKPQTVIDAEKEYYENYGANVHRGLYDMSEEATQKYEGARQKVVDFIHAANSREIIFTRNATEAVNLVAVSWAQKFLKEGDEIIVTIMEHHSNIVPWQMLAKRTGCILKFWDINDNGILKEDELSKLLTRRSKLLAITHVSNAIGTINPLKPIIQKAHAAKLKVLVDAAQSIPHMGIDVSYLDTDFLVFSGHKMCGPTGIGVLYAKERVLETMDPFLFGGDMILEVKKDFVSWNDLPWRFEAGTPNIAGAIGLGAAIDYLKNIGLANIREHEKNLLQFAVSEMKKLPFIKMYGSLDPETQAGVLSFTIEGVHPHDIGTILNEENICIRVGSHCAMPLMTRLGIVATARASFYLYNTEEDVARLVEGLKKVHGIFFGERKHVSQNSEIKFKKPSGISTLKESTPAS